MILFWVHFMVGGGIETTEEAYFIPAFYMHVTICLEIRYSVFKNL